MRLEIYIYIYIYMYNHASDPISSHWVQIRTKLVILIYICLLLKKSNFFWFAKRSWA